MFKSWRNVSLADGRTRFVIALLIIAYVVFTLVWAVFTGHVILLSVVMAVMAIGGLLVTRMTATKKTRRAKIQALQARTHTRWPKILVETLTEDEIVEHEGRKHPFVILDDKRVALFGALCVAMIIGSIASIPVSKVLSLLMLVLAIMALSACLYHVAPRAIDWWFTRRCFTNIRVIVITGIFTKDVDDVILYDIKKATHSEHWLSPILMRLGLSGIWTWRIDTEIQQDAFNVLEDTPHPLNAKDLTGDSLQRYALRSRPRP